MWKLASPDRYQRLKGFAKENRQHPTRAEIVFWELVRANRLGYKFDRQHIVGDYIVDFYCQNNEVVVEIDGGYHSEIAQQEDDQLRTEWLESIGQHVIRFSNDEVIYDYETVKTRLLSFLKQHDSKKYESVWQISIHSHYLF